MNFNVTPHQRHGKQEIRCAWCQGMDMIINPMEAKFCSEECRQEFVKHYVHGSNNTKDTSQAGEDSGTR